VHFRCDSEIFRRLPRHPDFKYEFFDGQAWLSPRARPINFIRSTALPVEQAPLNAEVRELDLPSDRAAVATLLEQTWLHEAPYSSLDAPEEVLRSEVEQGLNTAAFGAVAFAPDSGTVSAAALVHQWGCGSPTLTWLTVARHARERGLATALLALITTALRDRDIGQLASGASGANLPSIRFHLSRKFELAEDPLREALRDTIRAPRARDNRL
jgi:hypothetical protein